MAGSDKIVYKIIRRARTGVVVLAEVTDGEVNYARVRETKDSRIALGQIGSFWLVSGEKKEPKLAIEATESSIFRKTWQPPQMVVDIRAHAQFELPETVEEFNDPGRHEARSFASALQLSVGFSPKDKDFESAVSHLRSGTLTVPTTADVTAIEVRPGGWVTTDITRSRANLYGFAPGKSIRSIAVSSASSRLDTVRLSDGLVIFVTQPNWSFGEVTDLRTQAEIVEAAEMWLARARSAAESAPGSEDDLAEGLRKYISHTVEADEKSDLIASVRLLATRDSLVDILPQIMAREPLLQEQLKAFEQSEKDRIRAAMQSTVEAELNEERKRLAAIQSDLVEAETRLSVATHRESLLRAESEKHDESVRTKLAEAARQISTASIERTEHLSFEVEQLKEKIADLTRSAPIHLPPQPLDVTNPGEIVAETSATQQIEASEFATDEGRSGIVAALRQASGLSAGEIAGLIAYSTEGIPVLIGAKASAVAADIVIAIGGDDAAVAFCDPTRISWHDLLQDETSGLALSVAYARSNPDTLVPIAICNITNGPSEFWIPQLIESRRIGRIPRNIAIIASAGIDGMRVSMSDSALHQLMPVIIPDKARPVRKLFSGVWPFEANLNRTRLAEARDVLSDQGGLEGAALDRGSRTLSRVPVTIAMAEAADLFIRNAHWLTALAADGKHEFNQYFKNIEG